MSELGTKARPLRVAIVGSGPSGFYAAEALFKSGLTVQVDMFDRLPTPFGLVRGGVAPDHQKIKNVIKVYEKIASSDGFGFLGNVNVGRDITVNELRSFYDALIFSYGSETDNRLGIPGEDLPGSHTATEFVGWYNGHPDYRDREFDLSGEVAVVIGQGNVAMDVSRILAKTVDELKDTDIAQHALDALAQSNIKEIHLIGRRGPVQAKFTPPEIREIGELADCDVVVNPKDIELSPADQTELDDPSNKSAKKNYEVLKEFASRPEPAKTKRYFIHFYESPVELQGDDRLETVVLEVNRLEGEPFKQKAVGTGEKDIFHCDIFFRSVGYRGVAMPGLPFEERRGTIPNEEGRIVEDGVVIPGLYVAGWIKRGPSGVIGTNKPDAAETVKNLIADAPTLAPCERPHSDALIEYLRGKGVKAIDFDAWKRIDAAEIERGQTTGKPREKFTRVDEMLGLLE